MKNDITPQIKSDLKQLREEMDAITERWKNEDGFNIEVEMKEHIRKWGDSEAFKIDLEEDNQEKEKRRAFFGDFLTDPIYDNDLTAYIENNKKLIKDIIDKHSFLNNEYINFVGAICFALSIGGDAGKEKVEYYNNNLVNIHKERLPVLEALSKDHLLKCLLNLDEEKVNEVLEDFIERSNLPVIKNTTENTYLDWHIYNFIVKNKKDKIIRARQIDVLLYIFRQFNYYGYTATTDKFAQNEQFERAGKRIDYIATFIKEKFKS